MNPFEIGLILILVVVAIYFAYELGKDAGRRETIRFSPHISVDASLIVAALKGYGYRIARDESNETRPEVH